MVNNETETHTHTHHQLCVNNFNKHDEHGPACGRFGLINQKHCLCFLYNNLKIKSLYRINITEKKSHTQPEGEYTSVRERTP